MNTIDVVGAKAKEARQIALDAADRIEELEADLQDAHRVGAEWFEQSKQNHKRATTAEAKLAKAVEAFDCWLRMMDNPAYDLGEMVSEFDVIVSTTLAELKEQK
jgi:hypothetical protein